MLGKVSFSIVSIGVNFPQHLLGLQNPDSQNVRFYHMPMQGWKLWRGGIYITSPSHLALELGLTPAMQIQSRRIFL